jgi:tetratricopeptide (TPR) repeat protein
VYYKKRKEAAFALVFYFVNIILFFQFIPVGYAVVCDRYTYVPYIGLAMLISGGVTGIIELNTRFVKYLAVAFAIIFVGSLSFLAHQRSKVWLDSYTLWNDAIKNNSSSARAFANRGFAFIENRAYDQALADLKRSAELDFNSAKVHFAMANAYMFKKQYDKAADCYCNAIKVDPSAPSSYLHLGLAYNMLNRDIDALQQFTKAASICPVYPEAYYAMGNTYFKIKEYDRAVESFTEALRYSQNNFFLYGNRGYSYFKLAKYDKALADFNRALELNPYYTPARKHREEVLKFINR